VNRPRRKDRHLPANVYFKHGRHWYVTGGKWKKLAVEPAAALREYADIIEKPRGGCGELLGAAYTAMSEREGDGKLAPNTLKQYKIARDRLAKILAAFAPEQVKPKHIAAIKLALAKTPNMCNRLLSFGRQAFDFALEAQLIESNPFVGIKRHREKKRTRLYSWAEWNAIYNGPRTGERLRLIMDALYLTDQRIDDVLQIDERDERPEGIYFRQDKTGAPLIIKWNDDLRAWWTKCRAQHAKVERIAFSDPTRPRPLFRTKKGTRPAYRTIYDQWVVAAAAAGVEDANMHDGRAFSATENEKQHGKAAAQAALGHVTEQNTNRYLRDRSPKVVKGPAKKSA
jgi:site-specific recombinase XerD